MNKPVLSPEEVYVLQVYRSFKPQFRKKYIQVFLEPRGEWSKTAPAKAEALIESLKAKGMLTPQNAMHGDGKMELERIMKELGIYKYSTCNDCNRETFIVEWYQKFQTQNVNESNIV